MRPGRRRLHWAGANIGVRWPAVGEEITAAKPRPNTGYLHVAYCCTEDPSKRAPPRWHGSGAPIRGGIVVLFAIIRISSRRPAASGRLAGPRRCARPARIEAMRFAERRRTVRVVGGGSFNALWSGRGPNNRHNRLSGGLVPPFKYRKYRTHILLQIPGNIPRFVGLTTYHGDPAASCLSTLSTSLHRALCFLLGRIMSNASHRAGGGQTWRPVVALPLACQPKLETSFGGLAEQPRIGRGCEGAPLTTNTTVCGAGAS